MPAVLFSLALTGALVVGRSLYLTTRLSLIFGSTRDLMLSLLRAVLIFLATVIASSLLMRLLAGRRGRLPDAAGPPASPVARLVMGERWPALLFVWAILLACWLPCLLAYWPGIFSYDMLGVMSQGGSNGYNLIQPLLYTLFAKAVFAVAGNNYTGILLMSITQMILLSAAFAVVVWRLNRLRVHAALRWVCLIWFAVYPVIPLFAIAETKDSFFAAVFALTTLSLIELTREPGPFFSSLGRPIALGAELLLLGMLRDNAVIVLALLTILIAVFQRKDWGAVSPKLVSIVGGAAVVTLLISHVLLPALGVHRLWSRMELSVPVQQVGYTHKLNAPAFTQKQRDAIYYWIRADVDHDYNPRFADPLMMYSHDWGLDRASAGFFKVWLQLGIKYPDCYTEAFLNLTLQSWYPGTTYPDLYAQRDYIETNIYYQAGVTRASKAPALYALYEDIAISADWDRIPVASLLFDTGVPIWFMLFGIAASVFRKTRRDLIVFLLPLCLWATIMLGPVTNGRYMFPFFASYPLWIVALLSARPRPDEQATPASEEVETGGPSQVPSDRTSGIL